MVGTWLPHANKSDDKEHLVEGDNSDVVVTILVCCLFVLNTFML